MTSVVLVGGPGGAGSSTVAARLADALARDGAAVGVSAADPEFGAGALVTEPRCVVLEPRAAVSDELLELTRAYGVGPLLPSLSELSSGGVAGAIWALPDQVDAGVLDHVVVDAGAALRSLHVTVRALASATGHAQSLNPGWLRTARPLGALGLATGGGARMAQAARALATRVDRLSALISASPVLLIHPAAGDPDARTAALARAVVLGGGRLGGVLGNPGDDLADRLAAYGVPVLATIDAGLPALLADPPASPDVVGGPGDDRVLWRTPLPFNRIDDVEVDRVGDSLAVQVGSTRRLFTLPSLLARYSAHGVRVRQGMLEVAFTPTEEARQ